MRPILAALAVFLALAAPSRAEEPLALIYAVHVPVTKPESPPPLLVLLHGQGANELDLIGLWPQLPLNFVVVSPRAPFANANGGFRWYVKGDEASVEASRRKILSLIATVSQRYGTDPSRTFVAGFSQGAVMSYQVGLTAPDRIRGAGVMSGSLFHSALGRGDASREAFFVAHGEKDDRIPFSEATRAKAELAKLGAPTEFHAYPGMGHEITDTETSDFAAWLVKTSRR